MKQSVLFATHWRVSLCEKDDSVNPLPSCNVTASDRQDTHASGVSFREQFVLTGTLWRVSWCEKDGLVSPLLQFEITTPDMQEVYITQSYTVDASLCDTSVIPGALYRCIHTDTDRIISLTQLDALDTDSDPIPLHPSVCPVCRTTLHDGKCLCFRCGAKSQRLLTRYATAMGIAWCMSDRYLFQYLITTGRIKSPDDLHTLSFVDIKELDTNLFSDEAIHHFLQSVHACHTTTMAHVFLGYLGKCNTKLSSVLNGYDFTHLVILIDSLPSIPEAQLKARVFQFGAIHGKSISENTVLWDALTLFNPYIHPENYTSLQKTLSHLVRSRMDATITS